ncbi:glutamate racemase [Litorimonas haliclonae]|uniref:glutamate racemase n=1 Tax=Litorimonas haliclonae TaxID=2081977 RepID=UPI0039EF34B0
MRPEHQTYERHRALVFDSGVGGLSVVGEIRNRLPDLALDYVADDAFRPYGEKSEAELTGRLPGLLATLAEMTSPDCIVIACNTASVTALEVIRAEIDIPVIGVVPAIKPAAAWSRTGTIGVLGTPGTVRRKYVGGLIQHFAGDCQVVLQGSVNLVEMAERKLAGESIDLNDIRREIAPLFEGREGADIDAVVLACTHFPLLREDLQRAARQTVRWIDSGAAIAKRVDVILNSIEKQKRTVRADTAFLIGPVAETNRKAAFQSFGFDQIVGLVPG